MQLYLGRLPAEVVGQDRLPRVGGAEDELVALKVAEADAALQDAQAVVVRVSTTQADE